MFRNRRPIAACTSPTRTFHGLTLNLRLPGADRVHGAHFTVAADIGDCPDLELVLPTRKEAALRSLRFVRPTPEPWARREGG